MPEEPRRPPDPFRPGEIEEGRPFAKAGRPGAAVLVPALIVVVAAVVLIFAVAR